MEGMLEQSGLVGDVNFWYRLKVDYDSVPDSPDRLKNLILEFFKGRKASVEAKIKNPASYAENAACRSEKEIRGTLSSIYINHLWNQSKTGHSFKPPDGGELGESLNGVLTELSNDGAVVEQGPEGFVLVYHIKPSLVDETDEKRREVHGRKLLTAETSIMRVSGDSLEIRGKKGNLYQLKRVLKEGGIEEIEPALDSRPIITSLNKALEEENPIFDIVGIKYSWTNLPTKSRLAITNSVNIGEDIKHLGDNHIIVPNAITDISQIIFRFKKLGKTVKLKIKNKEAGFEFEIDDKKLTQAEREQIKNHLEKTFSISFDKIHDYASQYDERFIFHKILSGSVIVYEKYFRSLSGPLKEILEEIVTLKTEEYWKCSSCDRESDEGGSCNHCGGDLKKYSRKRVDIDDSHLLSLVLDAFGSLKNRQIDGLKVNEAKLKTLGNKKVQNLSVFRSHDAKNQIMSRPYSFFVHPLGDDHLSHRINEYMHDTVLVTYGQSSYKQSYSASFGVIDLYDLVKGRDAAELLRAAIDMSNRLKERRLVEASNEARHRLENLAEEKGYNDKHFERDIFFILKRMAPYSERWGREFKREADGVVIFADDSDEYFIASYDPKFTEAESYDLDSEEQNKAVFYLLNENANKKLKLLTKSGKVNAHILISNRFREGQLKGYYEGVKKFMRLTKADGSSSAPPIVFLPLDMFMEIYRIYDSNWDDIKSNVKFHKEFFLLLSEILTPSDGYKLVTQNDIARLEADVIALKETIKKKSAITQE